MYQSQICLRHHHYGVLQEVHKHKIEAEIEKKSLLESEQMFHSMMLIKNECSQVSSWENANARVPQGFVLIFIHKILLVIIMLLNKYLIKLTSPIVISFFPYRTLDWNKLDPKKIILCICLCTCVLWVCLLFVCVCINFKKLTTLRIFPSCCNYGPKSPFFDQNAFFHGT